MVDKSLDANYCQISQNHKSASNGSDSDEEGEGYELQPLHPQVLVVDDDPMNIEVM